VIISPDILRRDTIQLINQINAQIEEVEAQAKLNGVKPTSLVDHDGNFVLPPLLLAKATTYNTLVMLQTDSQRQKK